MIETERLILRDWRDEDLAPLAALNADPQVMEHFPAVLTRADSDALAASQRARIAASGRGFMALERRDDGAFLGFVGVKPTSAQSPFAGAPEIGWRLARSAWGCGYAGEAARAALADAFDRGADEVVSFTATTNLRSQAVMARLGMIRAPERDFDHPALPRGHRLERHVVYALRSAQRFATERPSPPAISRPPRRTYHS